MSHSQKSYQSGLRRVRFLGSAKSGTHHWIMQRTSAVALVFLGIWFVTALINLSGDPQPVALGWLLEGYNSELLILFVVASFYHAALGMKVVYEDYIHNKAAKYISILVTNFALLIMAVISIVSILRIYIHLS